MAEMFKSTSRYTVRTLTNLCTTKWIWLFVIIIICLILISEFHILVRNSDNDSKTASTETVITTLNLDMHNTKISRVQVVPTTIKNKSASSTKTILYWSNFLTAEDYYVHWRDDPFKKCPLSSCKITKDRSLLAVSDAVLFHPLVTPHTDLPPFRQPSQKFVFFYMEPPRSSPLLKEYNNFYNWTISYRTDSDIYNPYFKILPFAPKQHHLPTSGRNSRIVTTNLAKYRELKESSDNDASEVHFDYDKFIKNKTKGVAWVVSDCWSSSRRGAYAQQLSQYIQVDIYGKCGNLTCERGDACFQRIGREYKFYLAFENSICKDYVTEKPFNAFTHGVVPVVFGIDAHYQMAPPHSFIDAHKFDSPKALAKYLQKLMDNDNLYKEYLQWNENSKPETGSYFLDNEWCALCEALHDEERVRKTTVYPDMHEFWVTEAKCKYENVELERKRVEILSFASKVRDLAVHSVNTLLNSF